MRHNMGKIERIARIILGVALFLVGWRYLGAFGVFGGMVTATTVIGFIVALAGLVAFITGLLAYCPMNALLRINSCEACKVGETHRHLPV